MNNPEAGDLRRYRAHYDVSVMHWANAHPYVNETRLINMGHCINGVHYDMNWLYNNKTKQHKSA